ncbi:DUF2147 domain-containing protein [Phenylobacterium sp.]|uniref:DUF2147 domain-containing protein n=1 Tax=Phenylobacterium sp. TaxID=1871053 RepID=UPI0025F5F923|nr:DUF2147 domain-containing protein [Phenylobacterium sp.]
MRALVLAAGLLFAAAAPAFAADLVEGEWLTQDGSAKVRIGPCAGRPDRMCGLISWFRDPANARARDTHNPDPKLQVRPLMGLLMIRDFKAAGAGRWTGGRIYDPGEGKTYDSKMRINPDGTLKVEGCILIVCQAQTWKHG